MPRFAIAVGQSVILPQILNATVGTVESIDELLGTAVLASPFDVWGPLPRATVTAPLAQLRPFDGEPRMLGVKDLIALTDPPV